MTSMLARSIQNMLNIKMKKFVVCLILTIKKNYEKSKLDKKNVQELNLVNLLQIFTTYHLQRLFQVSIILLTASLNHKHLMQISRHILNQHSKPIISGNLQTRTRQISSVNLLNNRSKREPNSVFLQNEFLKFEKFSTINFK